MNIYVANIPFKSSEKELKELFERYGEVSSAKIILDRDTQLSRGFGFIDMPDNAAALEAINKVNGSNFRGKNLVADEARPKTVQSGTGFNRRE
jgi:RNA recognition motif-containing protein